MRNPSSDIPKARALLITALKEKDWRYVRAALPLMKRAKAVRRAPNKQKPITPAQKLAVRTLCRSDLTNHEIATRVGLANGGRVSEIITGKRK